MITRRTKRNSSKDAIMRNQNVLTITGCLTVIAIGCGSVEEPAKTPGITTTVSRATQWTKLTLHIDGFKKSKSGAI